MFSTHTLMEEDEYDLPYPQQSSQLPPPKWDDEIPILMNEDTGSSSISNFHRIPEHHASNTPRPNFGGSQHTQIPSAGQQQGRQRGRNFPYEYINNLPRANVNDGSMLILSEYNRLVSSADNTQNVTGQIRQLIIGYDPFRGTTEMQDKALQDIERLIIENMRDIDNYSDAFLNLASKSGQAFTQNMSDKYFSKLPPPFNSSQGQEKNQRATNYRNGIPRKNHIGKFKGTNPY
ncbi:hypothetical protein K1719_030875 [Acacia pycnantha]|nr:hypothetical protein K1719_030875 [Acacia pycnantha]